jgi:Uma2 family endonuclease
MTVAKSPQFKSQFKSFEAYLAADPSDLPEGRYEYWDGELIPVMSESLGNLEIADALFVMLITAGIPINLVKAGRIEVAVPGAPKTRFPDLVVLDEAHVVLLKKRATITDKMPPPRLLAEVVSPGDEDSENYQRDYVQKPRQYAAIGVPEYWIIDPDRAWVSVGVWVDGAYQFQNFTGKQTIVSPIFPGLNLTADQILSAGR